MTNKLKFERILALSTKASKSIYYTYGADLALAEEKVLDIWVKYKDEVEKRANFSEVSKTEASKKVYFFFKDKLREELDIYKRKLPDGRVVWYSPYRDEVISGYDTNEDAFSIVETMEPETQKEVFYEHLNDFDLTKAERIFIDLVFSGYHPLNDIDILVFKEVLQTESSGYVKTFFNRLCKKLKKQSELIGLR